jgi:ATP-binding cassette subfamily B protein
MKDYSLNMLRDKSLIRKDGVSLGGISNAVEYLGFKTVGGRFTIKQLIEKPYPCIIHWNQNHFIVVYDIKKHRKQCIINVADPGKGLLKYNLEEFQNHWISTQSGGEEKEIAILLEPTTSFYEKEEKKGIKSNKHRFLFQYFLRYKKIFGQLILGLTIGSLLQLIFPFLTQAIVDTRIINQDIGFIWLILFAQLMLLLGRTNIDFIRRKIPLHISTRINISLISDFLIKLMKLPMSFFDTKLLTSSLRHPKIVIK